MHQETPLEYLREQRRLFDEAVCFSPDHSQYKVSDRRKLKSLALSLYDHHDCLQFIRNGRYLTEAAQRLTSRAGIFLTSQERLRSLDVYLRQTELAIIHDEVEEFEFPFGHPLAKPSRWRTQSSTQQ